MAKQSFSVGQVLTAAQMSSLQETAMGGGAASSKTANYVLVAADAGTTISMTSTSATTTTVNTGLFSAGDTVFIQNLGSATCTITAGTATVNTAGSLILPQYDAGILYFVSASSAIFYDYIQVGAASPLTTKGDVYTFSTSDARLGVGANNTVLTADSAEATGLKWATPAASDATAVSLFKNQAISNATSTNISWATEYYDSSSFWSSGSTITIPTTGKYYMIITMRWPTSSTGWRSFALKQNGTNQWLDGDFNMSVGGSLQGQVITYSRGMSCTASDTIVLETYQNSGGSLTGDFTITIIRLGA